MSRSLSITSLNSNGVSITGRIPNKPLLIKQQVGKSTIVLLQETHTSPTQSLKTLHNILLQRELFVSHGTGNAAGLCTATPPGCATLNHCSDNFISTFLDIDAPVKFSGFVVNVYLHEPNTQAINRLIDYLDTIPLGDNIVIMGDFNMSPSPTHGTHSLFVKLHKQLRRLHIVHHPTKFPTHHPRNFNSSPSHIDHIFVRLPSDLHVTNTVNEYAYSDHNSLTLYITPTQSSPSAESTRNKVYNDPNFASFLLSSNKHQPLPHSYERFTTKLEDLASVYQRKFGKPKGDAPSFLFSLLHAFRTRDVERWNHTVNNVGKPDLAVRNAAQLAKSAEKLTHLFFLADSPFYVSDSNARKWYLRYLQKLIPPTKAGPLAALHPDESSPPVSDKEEVGSLISNTWGPVFRKIEPEYDIDDFLNRIEHLLPDYSDFSLDTSDKAILDSVMTTPKDSAPGPDGIPYSLIRNASAVFIPVIRSVLTTMTSGSLPTAGFADGFINFIPKKDLVPTPNNLRPLTIPNSIHRLVGKIISDQLQPSLNKNVHPCQSAFISGRWITDNVVSVNRILRQKKDGWLLFVDFSKAYDSVDRSALLSILRKFQFSKSVIAAVQASMQPYQVRSRYLNVAIDVDRGVPQGWSLSCVLFNIVIDPLLRTLSWALPDRQQSNKSGNFRGQGKKRREEKRRERTSQVGLVQNNQLFLHLSPSRNSKGRSIISSAFSDPTFAEYVSQVHQKQPLSSKYNTLLPSLRQLALDY